jgi:hypothetical protein
MVFKLGVEEGSQSDDTIGLSVLDVLHAAQDIFARFFVLDLIGTDLFFGTKVVSLRFLHLCGAGVVCKASILKLLAGSLERVMSATNVIAISYESCGAYLVFFHRCHCPFEMVKPSF